MDNILLGVQNILRQRDILQNESLLYKATKRSFDIVFTLVSSILFMPFFLLAILLVKLTSRGKIITSERMTGYKGKVFSMYQLNNKIIKRKWGTKVLLRLGWIPQLFNVLRGDMSIVGPKPHSVYEVAEYDVWHKLRMSVKPGIISLWEIFVTDEITFDAMLSSDLKYIRECCISYDLKIIIKRLLVNKRNVDILGALAGFVIFAPLFLVIGGIIKITSSGPILFKHKRVGQYGKEINIYKFRSKVQNAEALRENFTPEQIEEYRENYKVKKDPRVTPIGRILRKTSIDELPQIINILKGDMSIVGPRPVMKVELEKYGEYRDILLQAKPGLTGNWQINGRSDTTYKERVLMDVEYINNMSVLKDIEIILKTFIRVVKRQGAY